MPKGWNIPPAIREFIAPHDPLVEARSRQYWRLVKECARSVPPRGYDDWAHIGGMCHLMIESQALLEAFDAWIEAARAPITFDFERSAGATQTRGAQR